MKMIYVLIFCLGVFGSMELSAEKAYDPFSKELFAEVNKSLEGHLVRTPLIFLPTLSQETGKKIYLKDEARQKGNSFKTRGVTYEVFQTIHEVIQKNPESLKPGLQLVTQTDGNHGIALILAITSAIEKYSKEYPDLAQDIKKIEPVIFTYKNVLSVKRAGMDLAMNQYKASVSKTTQGTTQGTIYDSYKDYGDARVAREKYISESNGRAKYMEHGGIKTMHGHGVAALEIVEQLEQMGVTKDQKVCLMLPIGAGGPIGLAAALKANRPHSTAVMVQTPRYDAFNRSFKSGKLELNDGSLSPYTVSVEENGTTKRVIYEDGISVDGPESKEAVHFARRFLDDAISANPETALKIAPKILVDLDAYYNKLDKSQGIVGGTTAIVAEAILSNADNKCMKEAEVIVLFGTEGSIDPAIASYTRTLLKAEKSNENTSQMKPVNEPKFFVGQAKGLLEWNKEKLTSRSNLALKDIGDVFASEFLVLVNGRKYTATYESYFEFLNKFRSNIAKIDYDVQEYIVMGSTVVMPLTARVKRLDGKEDLYDAIMLLKFNDSGKIIHWQEVYSIRS